MSDQPSHAQPLSVGEVFFAAHAPCPAGAAVKLTIVPDFGDAHSGGMPHRFQVPARVVRAETGTGIAFNPRDISAVQPARPEQEGTGRPATIGIVGETLCLNDLLAARICQDTGANCSHSPLLPRLMAAITPDLVLLDCAEASVSSQLELIARENLSTRLTYMAFFNVRDAKSPAMEVSLINTGIRGIFYRDIPFRLLLKGVRSILNNQLWFSREAMSDSLLGKKRPAADQADACSDELSPREKEILLMLAEGASNKDIADKLFLSLNTIKSHIYNIYKKIGVPNRSQATLWASRCLNPKR